MIKRGKKFIFGFRDTYSLDYTLRPIIRSGLIKYKEVIQERHESGGVMAVPSFLTEDGFSHKDEKFDEIMEKWVDILDEMIIGFSDDPDIGDYDFSIEFIRTGDAPNVFKAEIVNKSEHDRFVEDCKKFSERALNGRMLFAKYYDHLTW